MMDKYVWHLLWKLYSTGQEAQGRTTLRNYIRAKWTGQWDGKRYGMRIYGASKNSH